MTVTNTVQYLTLDVILLHYYYRLMPELEKVLHSMKLTLDNSSNPPKHSIPNAGVLVRFFFAVEHIYLYLILIVMTGLQQLYDSF